VDPGDPNVIYVPNVALLGSQDGGRTIEVVRGAPGGDDYHEIWVDPKDSSRMILGVDQGTTISVDHAKTWTTWYNQPTAQMYHVTTDNQFPYVVYGAQQDSGGAAVYSRTDHGRITPRDWFPASGSESGYFAIDPNDSNILYVTGGYGTVSRWDKKRAVTQDVSPWPMPVFGTDISSRKYRDPWTPPLVFSPVDKAALYLGTQYVMKTTDGGLHWSEISPDLTGAKPGTPRAKAAVVASGAAASAQNSLHDSNQHDGPTIQNAIERGYGTLATVAPSYLDKNIIWAGSDTGVISVTRDGGGSWANVTPPPMQPWSRVSLIEPSHYEAGSAYAAVERHRVDDQSPYIYRTRNYGKTWETISAGLTAPAFVNAVREDPEQRGLLYAGTEFGIYVSFDDGGHWQPLQLNLPVTSVRDMVVHENDLVVATHGRSFWILDDITPLRQAAELKTTKRPFLYRPEAITRIDNDAFPGTPLPPEEPTADNPPGGAILDYYLPADAHSIEMRIFDKEHRLVRHFSSEVASQSNHALLPIAARWFPVPQSLETGAGMHRFTWNLAWGTSGVTESDEPDDGNGDVPRGPKVAPGSYLMEFDVDGKLASTETVAIRMDPRCPASTADLVQQFDTSYKIFADSLQSRRALAEIDSVKEQLAKVLSGDNPAKPPLHEQAQKIQTEIDSILSGSSPGSEHAMGLEEANSALTATLNVAEGSERGTPAQALKLYGQAHGGMAFQVHRWKALKEGPVAELNRHLKAQGSQPIAIAEIEREVHYLMTR
jgi:hypothetical protein